ncbi:unnamed protein product (macronuclear) [Paramecium tetraurelia]|uniref:Transmembrane protein n=1 Tax=Paramecium tetraurelia TaxID=5888 RepID=A0CGB0_PARTE|nr:uncharacterized protein GSPATT00038272001 [Paramecium tetraurelia]CAK69827.1 unnamed protein product [Paramecium tetraurelia]|eukprot:XP_001437224.1 hypothetical protein (macronuclear) [Paramecium tetraurelia strain d4-2]
MLLIIIVFGVQIFQINSNPCEIQQIQPIITCYQVVQDCFILEGNEEDYYNLKHIDNKIVQKLFTISSEVVPIQTRIFKSLGKEVTLKKLICQLFLELNYYITCIKIDKLNYEKQENNQESIKIKTNITDEDSCDEIYQLDNGNLLLFCMTQFTLKQYQVSLLGDVTLIFEYDVSIQIQDKCKKKQFKLFDKNQFIIAFVNCLEWKLFEINNDQLKIIMESKTNNYIRTLGIFTKIDHVQICLTNSLTLYLVEANNYIQVIWESDQAILNNIQKSENQILKIILSKNCQNVLLITYKNETNLQPVQIINKEIILDNSFNTDQIHFFSGFLFLQNQNELNIRIDEHLYQKYNILNSSLFFLEQDNMFYQIDKFKVQAQFYRYFPISSYVKPKQKFVYLLKRLEKHGQQELLKCFKIQHENQLQQNNLVQYSLLIKKNCQYQQQAKLNIQSFTQFQQQEFEFYNNKTGNVKMSIKYKEKLENQCYQRIKRYKFKSKITLLSIKNKNFIVFQVENNQYFLNCQKNQIQLSVNIKQFEVLEYLEDYYIIDINKMKIEMIQLISGQIILSQIPSYMEMITIQQTSEQIILYVKGSEYPLLIYLDQFSQNRLNYLSQYLYQPKLILYYQELGSNKFIQYENIFAYELKGEVKCFQLSGVQIITIKSWLKTYFLLWAVQNQTNSIILYHLDEYELHLFSNYTLQEYQFSNPLKYKFSSLKLAILIENKQSLFIATYSITTTTIKLINIIQTNDVYFELINNTLLYLYNEQIWYHYLNEIVSLIYINVSNQQTLIQSYQLTLNPTYQFENSINLSILILNECHLLSTQSNQVSLLIQNNEKLKLKISEIFLGPIHNVTIIDNDKIRLQGPLQFIKLFKECVDSFIFCIKQKNIVFLNNNKQLMYPFSAIILEDKIFCQITQLYTENVLYQVFWISENYFLWICQLNDYLHIHLLLCILEDHSNCKELQVQIINFTVGLPFHENVIKTQNLVKLQNAQQQIYIFIKNQDFSLIHLSNNYDLDIKYIELSVDQFIGLERLDHKLIFEVEIMIYTIKLNGIYIEFFYNITKILQDLLPTGESNPIIRNIGLIQCKQNVTIITVILFMSYHYQSFMIQLQINIQNGSICSFQVREQIRNPLLDFDFKPDYMDENYLILKQLNQNITYYYDLQEEREYYDTIYRKNSHIETLKVNTTHFIFINQSQVYWGIINYELDIQNVENSSFNFVLFAQNEVSDAQISILLIPKSLYDSKKSIIIILLINLIFITLQMRLQYFRKIKQKEIKDLNNSMSQELIFQNNLIYKQLHVQFSIININSYWVFWNYKFQSINIYRNTDIAFS